MKPARWTGTAALVLISATAVSLAQPPGEQSPPRQDQPTPPGGDARRGPFSPEALTARLERRLAEIQREEVRVKEAIERLAKGEVVHPRDLAPGEGPGGRRGEGPVLRQRGPGGRGPQGPGAPGEAGNNEPALPLLREILPDAAERIERTMKERPELARRMMQRVAPHLREAMALKDRDPALFKLRTEEIRAGLGVHDAVGALLEAMAAKDAPDGAGKVVAARARLREALGQQADARLALEQHEVEALAKRVEELRKRLDERRAGKDKVLDEMLKAYDDGRDLPWGALMGPEGRGPREGEPKAPRPDDR